MKTNQPGLQRTVSQFITVGFPTTVTDQKGNEEPIHVKTRVRYVDVGVGPPVLLLHDAAQSLYFFKRNLSALVKHFRVILPDLPGHGLSGCPDMDYTIDDYSLFIEAFAKGLGLPPFLIIAAGQSAAYALDYCYYNAETVRKLALISPSALLDTHFAGAGRLPGMLGGMTIRRFQDTFYMERQLAKAFFDRTVLTRKDVEAFCRPYLNARVQQSVRMCVSNFEHKPMLEKLKGYTPDILFVTGMEDYLSSRRVMNDFFAAFPDSKVLEVRNAGALPHFEKPQVVNGEIIRFLTT